MNRALRILQVMLAAALTVPGGARAQDGADPARNSITVRGGYAVASGDWNKVPYLPDVTMMAGSFTYGITFDVRIASRWTLAFDGGFENLSGSDWESYSNSRGDTLAVDVSCFYAAVLLRPHLTEGGENIVRMEFGPAVVFPSGKERLNGRLYSYDFFSSTKIGGLLGIEYDRSLNPWIALAVRASVLAAPTGVSYADGETRMLVLLPITAGIRFYF